MTGLTSRTTARSSSARWVTSSSRTSSRRTTRSAYSVVSALRADAQDNDGALSQSELDDLFSTSPGNPWLAQGFPDTTITDDMGRVTLQGWLAQWS